MLCGYVTRGYGDHPPLKTGVCSFFFRGVRAGPYFTAGVRTYTVGMSLFAVLRRAALKVSDFVDSLHSGRVHNAHVVATGRRVQRDHVSSEISVDTETRSIAR